MAAPPDLQQTLERLGTTLEKSARQWREHRQEERESRKANRRARRREKAMETASVPRGLFMLVMALVMVGFAVTHLQFWWLLFVAFGIGSGGVNQVVFARERERQDQPAKKQEEAPKQHEVDALCDQLLADLQASPEVVRTFVQQPERTVEALRTTAKAVDQRRQDLANTKFQLTALEKQRQELKQRRDASSDVEARLKFDGALRSLDGQEAALQTLTAVGDRLDGEYTSLLVLLQELRTRVAVAKSTSSSSQLEGLEQNVKRLNDELQAITESLVMAPIDEGVSGSSSTTQSEKVRSR